jgi:hypothetical protein
MQNRCFENTPNYDDDDERFLRRKISETLAHLWNSSLKHANLPRDCVYDGKAGELYWLTQMCALYPDSLPGLYEKSKAICETLIKTIQKHQSSFQRHANDTSLLCGLAGQVLAVWHHLQIFQPALKSVWISTGSCVPTRSRLNRPPTKSCTDERDF